MIKSIKKYKIGLSLFGLIAFALQELPYLPWLLWPPANNPLANNAPATPLLGLLEQVGGVLTIALLILVIRKDDVKPSFRCLYVFGAAICLAIYYICWICYFVGVTNGWLIVIGLSAIVPIYYLFVSLWLKNYFVTVTSVFFLIGHTISNGINFLS